MILGVGRSRCGRDLCVQDRGVVWADVPQRWIKRIDVKRGISVDNVVFDGIRRNFLDRLMCWGAKLL